MKKIYVILFCIFLLIITGCSSKKENTQKIYSFSGESQSCSLNNGVIVNSTNGSTFYSGILKVNEDEFKEVTSITACFYVLINKEKTALLNHSITNEDKDSLSINQMNITSKTTSESGYQKDIIAALKDHMYLELKVTKKNGKTKNYRLPMEVVEITENTIN